MKRFVFSAFIVLLIATVCYAAAGVTGRWTGTIAGLYDVTVNMKEDNGKITGVVTTEIGDIPLSNGVITGSDIAFKEFSYNGIAVSYIKGKIDGEKMNITVGFQGTSFNGTLKKVK